MTLDKCPTPKVSPLPHIYIDGDACPVRDESYKIALRHDIALSVVSNSFLRVPRLPNISLKLVSDGFDAADDYIAERAGEHCIVVTADILLAQRCLEAGARALAPTGKIWDNDNIGSAIAVRAIMADLRAGAENSQIGGPPPFSAADRSRFLQNLHELALKLKARA